MVPKTSWSPQTASRSFSHHSTAVAMVSRCFHIQSPTWSRYGHRNWIAALTSSNAFERRGRISRAISVAHSWSFGRIPTGSMPHSRSLSSTALPNRKPKIPPAMKPMGPNRAPPISAPIPPKASATKWSFSHWPNPLTNSSAACWPSASFFLNSSSAVMSNSTLPRFRFSFLPRFASFSAATASRIARPTASHWLFC